MLNRALHTGLLHVPYISEIISHRFTSRVIYFRYHCTHFTSRAIYFRDLCTHVYITCHIFQRPFHTGLHHVSYISEIIAHILPHVPYISEIIAHTFTSRAIYFRDHCTEVYITCHMLQRSLHTGLHHVPYASEIIAHRFTSRAICFRDHCTQVYITCHMPRRSLHTGFICTVS